MKIYLSIIFAGFLLATGCVTDTTQTVTDAFQTENVKFTKHFDNTSFKITEKGLFSVEIVTGRKELRVIGKNAAGIVIHDSHDEDVEGADIQVNLWLPAPSSNNPQGLPVNEKGGGLYIIENVNFPISGYWELRIKVKKNNLEDSAIFIFPDVTKENLPAGKYDAVTLRRHQKRMMMDEKQAPADTVTSTLSKNKMFRVLYISDQIPVPLIKIHNWRLRIESPDGKPINDAEVTLDGKMSGHLHGLPTKPRVTKGTEDGSYAVEGIKFNMPGWWEVTFNIKVNNQADTVTFSLLVE